MPIMHRLTNPTTAASTASRETHAGRLPQSTRESKTACSAKMEINALARLNARTPLTASVSSRRARTRLTSAVAMSTSA